MSEESIVTVKVCWLPRRGMCLTNCVAFMGTRENPKCKIIEAIELFGRTLAG